MEESADEGVAAIRRMVGIAGLVAGVSKGDGERVRMVSVGRERSCKGISSSRVQVKLMIWKNGPEKRYMQS